MTPPGDGANGLFDAGVTVVRRVVYRDRVWSAWPGRVVHDTGDDLAVAHLAGIEVVSQKTSIEALHSKDRSLRERSLAELTSGEPDLGTSVIDGTTILGFYLPDTYFSVLLFFRENGELRHWYVNFERPYARSAIGVDTFDLMIDLVIEPDRGHRWKDEDEYAHGRRLGIVDDATHAEVERARGQALAMVERREGPFEERWRHWRVDPTWPLPVLPDDVLTAARAL